MGVSLHNSRTGLCLVDVCSELAGGHNVVDVDGQMIQNFERQISKWMFGTFENLPRVGGEHGDGEVLAPGLPEVWLGEISMGFEFGSHVCVGVEVLY